MVFRTGSGSFRPAGCRCFLDPPFPCGSGRRTGFVAAVLRAVSFPFSDRFPVLGHRNDRFARAGSLRLGPLSLSCGRASQSVSKISQEPVTSKERAGKSFPESAPAARRKSRDDIRPVVRRFSGDGGPLGSLPDLFGGDASGRRAGDMRSGTVNREPEIVGAIRPAFRAGSA